MYRYQIQDKSIDFTATKAHFLLKEGLFFVEAHRSDIYNQKRREKLIVIKSSREQFFFVKTKPRPAKQSQ